MNHPVYVSLDRTTKFYVWTVSNRLRNLIESNDFARSRASIDNTGSDRRTICAFCFENCKLLKSHFIPACVLRRIGQDKMTYELVDGQCNVIKNAGSQESRWTRWLFCKDCEEKFFGEKFEKKLDKNMKPIPGIKIGDKNATLLLKKNEIWFDEVCMKDFKSCHIHDWDKAFWATVVFRSILATANCGLTDWEILYVLQLHDYLFKINNADWKSVSFPYDIKMSILVDYCHPIVLEDVPIKMYSLPASETANWIKEYLLSSEYDYRFFTTGIEYDHLISETGIVENRDMIRLRVGHLTILFGPHLNDTLTNKVVAVHCNEQAKNSIKYGIYPYTKSKLCGPEWQNERDLAAHIYSILDELAAQYFY